jgi:alpha-tubulin suppressor-like RCC1 family protein
MVFAAGRRTTGATRRGLRLLLSAISATLTLAISATLALAIAAPAQGHEPYVVKSWGFNQQGELGDGTNSGPEKCGPAMETACSAAAVEVSKLSGVAAVSAGDEHALALLQDGTVMAWGSNESGQLGDGGKTGFGEGSDVPVKVAGLSERVTAVAAGGRFSLALLASGKVMAWGGNNSGELGDGSTTSSDVPVEVTGLAERVKAIAAAGDGAYALALLEGGKVVAWGTNGSGQLGNGTTKGSEVPVEVSGLSEKVKAVSAGSDFALALLESGTVMAWGGDSFGELGSGGETNSSVPLAVTALTGVAALAAGEHASLALLGGTGKVMAWGRNDTGELGDGANTGPEMCGSLLTACAKAPVEVSGLSGAAAVAAGAKNGIALAAGRVVAWGENEYGGLGEGSTLGPEPCGSSGSCSTKPVAVVAGTHQLLGVKGISYGGGESSKGFGLAFGPPPPAVTALTPGEGPKGGRTRVTITGADLEGATQVKFGFAEATSFTVNSESSITAVSPPGTGIVDVTVVTPAGTSPTSTGDQFNYSRPTIKRISPRRGPAAGGTTVTITGASFTGATAVKFGANTARFKVSSDSSITAVSPASTTKVVDVTVTTPTGTSALTSKDRFHYRLS